LHNYTEGVHRKEAKNAIYTLNQEEADKAKREQEREQESPLCQTRHHPRENTTLTARFTLLTGHSGRRSLRYRLKVGHQYWLG